MQRIFVNIASLLDKELIPTIKSALAKSREPKNLHFSIVVQDTIDPLEEIKEIIDGYGATMDYIFLPLEEVRGVGYARMLANQTLTEDFEFYLQIDSHMRFKLGWDITLISLYNKEGWDNECKFIYTTYPKYYGYVSDLPPEVLDRNIKDENGTIFLSSFDQKHPATISKIRMIEGGPFYDFELIPWSDDFKDRITYYFCAGFAFGRTEYFLQVPVDPHYSYSGEELTISIRFYYKDILLVTPPTVPIFHDYDGHKFNRRASFFINQETFKEEKSKIDWEALEKIACNRLDNFREGLIDDGYGVTADQYNKFIEDCVIVLPRSSIDANVLVSDSYKMLPLATVHT